MAGRRRYVHRVCGICPAFSSGWCRIYAKRVSAEAYRCDYGKKLIRRDYLSGRREEENARKHEYARAHRAERAEYNRQYRKKHRAQINAQRRERHDRETHDPPST